MQPSDDEYTDQELGRDSSQTLANGHFHPVINEDDLPEWQLPKQVHAGDLAAKGKSNREQDDLRSYNSNTENAQQVYSSKNMKDSLDSKYDYRVDSKSYVPQNQLNKDTLALSTNLVRSPSELANKYELKLGGQSTVIQYSEKNTKISSQMNQADHHMHLINDLSIENKFSRIEMAESASQAGTNNIRKSVEDSSYFCDTDLNRDFDRSRSRSNPRANDLVKSKQASPSRNGHLIIDDDEITERIRLQGERLIQQPEIMHNQPHKALERAMKGQKENVSSHRNSQNGTNGQNDQAVVLSSIESKDFKVVSNREESLNRRNVQRNFSRETSKGRDDNIINKAEIFDGSFGRKKRQDSGMEWQRPDRFKIESKPQFKDSDKKGALEQYNSKSSIDKEHFERKFGIMGPSGRQNRLSQKEYLGIGSGIPLITYERSSRYNQFEGKDNIRARESKSIPRESIALDHTEKQRDDKNDQNFSDLVKRSENRRTYSTSPYGGLRSNLTSSYRSIDQTQNFQPRFANQKQVDLNQTDREFKNQYRSPLDELYKQHQSKGSSSTQFEKKEETVDDQFKQCQELLQRAKDRRLKISMPGKSDDLTVSTKDYLSKRSSNVPEKIDVPDVKSLQTRYEYLMDTIKEKESEGTRTENSLQKSEYEKRKLASATAHAKTMKWRKSEKNQGFDDVGESTPVSEFQSKSLRVPKPPQSANQKSNITSTYEWLMKKHEGSISGTNDTNFKPSSLNENRYHAISFGLIQDGANGQVDSINNKNFIGSRHASLGKNAILECEQANTFTNTMNKYRPDLSQYSRNQSDSNERSFYKPMSPDIELSSKTNIARKQYNPVNQYGVNGTRQPLVENSLDREKVQITSGFEYQSKSVGAQALASSKFQIERRTYDNLNLNTSTNYHDTSYSSKQFDQGSSTTNLMGSSLITTNLQPSQASLNTGFALSQPKINSFNPTAVTQNVAPSLSVNSNLPSYSTNPASTLGAQNQQTSSQAQICGQIGKIIRQPQTQGPKQDTAKPQMPTSSFQSTQIFNNGDFGDSMFTQTEQMGIYKDQDKKVAGKVYSKNLQLDVQNSAPYSQPVYQNIQATSDSMAQSIKTGPSVLTPTSNGQLSSFNSQTNIFQRLDKAQSQFRSALTNKTDSENFKLMFFSKYAPSYQLKQFNEDFINDLVLHIDNMTNLFVELQKRPQITPNTAQPKDDKGALNSLDFNNDDQENTYQNIGQHLKEKYDTSKDPNTWVPQLYADMCKARKIASQNEENFKKEKEKNDELMKQIETLERDLLTFRKDLVQMENNQQINQQVEKKLKEQTLVELEWMERIDALLSSQKFYSNGDAPQQLPESAYDIETANPKKVFSQLLNKLEVLLCHQHLEKSKTKKFMETTVKQMDGRITYISEKFNKIQKKIIETCSVDGDEIAESNMGASHRTSTFSETSNDCPTMKGTIDMLKKIKKDRDEQERIIDQLKQIIQIQDKIYKADNQKLDISVKEVVMRNIENFVTEEHKKPSKNMQLGWVAEVSDIQIIPQEFGINDEYKSHSVLYKDRSQNFNQCGQELSPSNMNCDDLQGISILSMPQRDQIEQQQKKQVEMVTCEVQTEYDSQDKGAKNTKVYKEIKIQTDPVHIKSQVSLLHDDGKSDISISKRSSTTTERRDKQLHAFKEGLQQNMNEMLQEQLSKHISMNMSEIATIKQENGRLIEKYKNEQKQVTKLKDELRRKQKYEQFFEKQRAKKYRNCGCQIGPSQIKYAYEDQYSSSYNQKSISQASIAVKSQPNLPSKRFNKENRAKYSEKNEANIHLKNVLKSPNPSVQLRSPEDQTAKSVTEIASLNTLNMQQKYGVQDYSVDERTPTANIVGDFNGTRGNSNIYNFSNEFSKSASIIDESQLAIEKEQQISSNNLSDSNKQEKELLQYHIKKNQELHEVLRAYLMKFENGQSSNKQDANALLQILNPQSSNQLNEEYDTLNQRCPDAMVKENEDQATGSVLASSANFGLKDQFKEPRSLVQSIEKKRPTQQTNGSQQLSLEFSEKTDATKKCNFIDQYFNYKNNIKRELQNGLQNPTRQAQDDAQFKAILNQQSFGDANDLQNVLVLNYRSSSGSRQIQDQFANKIKQAQILDNHESPEKDFSKTERMSMQLEEQDHHAKQDDDVSDNNVSEQIKQIEGRQMLLSDVMDSAQNKNVRSVQQF